ncbi:hypothetical protein GCM10009789_03130 [Kribbella sancticallisti]|uniref:Uncharacterized protein n=1 Tax=Kribbella sancticallisti TaxID=460087 RepID=A0ABN2C5R9_9ACTN
MALSSASLSSSLRDRWLPADDGPYADSATASGDAFAAAVSSWFANATAGPYPCSTATARRGQLASSAGAALAAGRAEAAGALLATALVAYMAGQAFGPGVASPPLGPALAQTALTGVFADLDTATSDRADRMAQAVWALALTTIVVFPPVISPPAPVS